MGSFARAEGLNPDSVYFYRVVASNTINGNPIKTYGATMNFRTLAVKPIVTTQATTNVSTTNAIVSGTVNPNGSGTVFFFEYGTNNTFSASTAPLSIGNGTNTITNSSALTNLAAGQTYTYRAAASNSFGISYGSQQSFTAGLPPPSATTLTPAGLTTSGATLRGSVNPNDSFASAWFEWGTTTNYEATSRVIATDDAESYGNFNFTSPNNAGGKGFGNYSRFSAGTGSGTFLANNSSNQTIDPAKTFGAYAGSGTGISFRRPINTTHQYGSMRVSARFNVNNTKGFSGFNLKSTAGSGASGFSAGELVSFGIAPDGGNSGLLVTDASGKRVLDLGAPVTNTIIDLKVDFDALNRRYVVGAKFRTNSTFTTIGGTMSGTGTNVTHVGFASWNSTGGFQDFLFDGLQVLGSTALGGGTTNIAVSNAISSLSASTLYHYRVASMNLDGGITYGANASFYTGIDLAVSATNTNSGLVQGGAGQFTITVSNAGGSASSGTLTVSNRVPAGLTITAMSSSTNSGWAFNSTNLTATRTTNLAPGASLPAITVNFSVASNAPASLTNTVTVSGGGDGNTLNNTSNLTWSVASGPDLFVTKSTNSAFRQGTNGSFAVNVANIGETPTSGAVTVTEQPPAGMEIVSMTGTGWNTSSSNTVTRSDVLGANSDYPPITVSVAVASNAASVLTNVVTVFGGGDVSTNNNSAQSVANVALSLAPMDAWKTLHFGTTMNSAAADNYVATEDGMPNLLKYALGLDPTNTAALADRPAMQAFPPLAITFRRAKNATDVTINVEATDGMLNAWTNIWTSATNTYGGGTNSFEELTIPDPVPATNALQRYLRLKVTRP